VFVRTVVGFIAYEDPDDYDKLFLADIYHTLSEPIEAILKANLERIAPIESVQLVPSIVPASMLKGLLQDLAEDLSGQIRIAQGTLKVHAFYTFENWYDHFKDSLEGQSIETVIKQFRSFLRSWYSSVRSYIDNDSDIRIVKVDTSTMMAYIKKHTDNAGLHEVDETLWPRGRTYDVRDNRAPHRASIAAYH
jgi:hypothetical protein